MAKTDTELTPAEKLERRNGPCISLRCHENCVEYLFAVRINGFDTCHCGHTRWAHAEDEGRE